MYKLMIVDDEAAIRNGIANSIPWQELGFIVTNLSSNGLEALEAIEKEQPDIVLSDIRMPKMDGRALMQEINQKYPQIKIVILSGYSDFEYLNLSIKNKVTEYLLKPTDPDEIKTVFEKVKKEMDEENQKKSDISLWEKEYKLSKDRRFKDWLDTCIKGYSEDAYYQDEFYQQESLPMGSIENYYIMYIVPDGHLGDEPKELYGINTEIINICNYILEPLHSGAFCLTYEDTIVGLIDYSNVVIQEDAEKGLLAIAQQMQQEVSSVMGLTISVGISDACEHWQSISTGYTKAKICAMQSVFLGNENIFLYTQFANTLHLPQVSLNMELIKNAVLKGNYEGYVQELTRVIELFDGRPVKEYGYIDTICVSVMQDIAQVATNYSVWPEQIMGSLGVTYADISRCSSLKAKLSYVISVLFAFDKAIADAKNQDQTGKTNFSASEIKHILDQQYQENGMSLEYVAQEVNRSPAYVSRTFKSTYHTNFSTYLTKLRMEQAKNLLQRTNQKIYEIAQSVGYADASSFIKLFRKHFGISPNDFRMQKHEGKYEEKESD